MVRYLSLIGMTIIPSFASGDCTLNCPSDAPCVNGEADFSAHIITMDKGQGMHCACPYGWTGILCDKKYETCDHGHMCYHGGECVPGLTDKYGNDQLFCDCSNAVASDGTRYVGKYCETPFEQVCDSSGDTFCVNGAECNPNYPNFDANPCICEDGWEGFHCEFKKGTVPDCTLDCKNDGVCVVGVQDPAEAARMHHVWSQSDIDDHMRCLCPFDFGGPLCEASAEDCGGDTCYHGGTCVETSITDNEVTTSQFHCDCTTAADQDNLYAGKYCEAKSTSFCSATDENLFCTNGGSCNESDPLSGCDCPEGYFGFKCEFSRDGYDKPAEDEKCGEYYCLNNGKCITTTLELQDGNFETQQACDCSTSFDGVSHYAGSSCQYKSTSVCSDNLFCVHNGTCPVNDHEGCSCPDGWKGDSCEIHIYALEDEYPSDPQCGGNVCLNGGKCIETQIQKSNDLFETLYHCDCSTAFDDKHHYAGESCQFPSTHICTLDEKVEDRLFCTNFGTCNRDDPKRGCDCPAGFEGFSCEFENVKEKPSQSNPDPTDLEVCGDKVCQNGGVCVKSLIYNQDNTKTEIEHCDCTTTITDKTAFAGDQCQFEATKFCNKPIEGVGMESDSFYCVNNGDCSPNIREGCVCPIGWSGFKCQFPEEASNIVDNEDKNSMTCGDLTCQNGGTCESIEETNTATGDKSTVFKCNCASATGLFAGPQCEYESTDVCSKENPSGSFCVNGGTCKGEGAIGCDCKAGWEGPMCDVLVKDDSHATKGEQCGDGYCYNNGSCVETKITKDNGVEITEFHCDCNEAFDDTHRYGGLSCEHQSTSFCSRSNHGNSLQGVAFCVRGSCSETPGQGCECLPGWTGFSCEFQTDNVKGDVSGTVDQCGADLACLNGGKCATSTVKDSNGNESELKHCDCSAAIIGGDIFAGKQCEFKQTSFCSKPQEGKDLSTANYCTNHGTCKENILSGCDCKDGFEGFSCEYEKDSKDLIDNAEKPKLVDNYVECSDFYCYNGSTCSSFLGTNGQTQYKCSCDTAATGSTLFAGKYCQYEMTSLCTKGTLDSLTGADFCVNNGKCPEGEEDTGCDCPAGYTGYRCDEPLYAGQDNEDKVAPNLSDDDDDDDAADFYQCRLQCQNGGTCAKGAKDLSHFHGQFDHVSHLNQTFDHAYFEHCICKDGWFGLECEHKAEVCGADEHLCLHGSKCVKNNQEHGCDCSQTDETIGDSGESLFAGDSCEHPATDICIYGNDYPGRPLYFCTNQGQCLDYVSQSDPEPGCLCPPEWKGPHCEIRVDYVRLKSPPSDSGALVFVGIFFILTAIVAFSYLMFTQRSNGDPSTSCMPFRRRRHLTYDPDDESNNLAPKRSSAFSPPNDMSPPPSRNFSFKSGSDPMTAFELPPDNEPRLYQDEPNVAKHEPFQDEPDDEPEQEECKDDPVVLVNVGPARDEDGNQLHNVDFL